MGSTPSATANGGGIGSSCCCATRGEYGLVKVGYWRDLDRMTRRAFGRRRRSPSIGCRRGEAHMQTKQRQEELNKELDQVLDDQERADKQHRRDIEEARKSGDWRGMRGKTKKYIEGNNERAKRYDKILEELDS
jgi:hypothetical protein